MATSTLEKVGESYYKSTTDRVRDKNKTYYIITGWFEKRKATRCKTNDFKDDGSFRSMHDNYWYYVWNFCNTKKQGERFNIEGVTEVDKNDFGYIYKEKLTGQAAENAKRQIEAEEADQDPDLLPISSSKTSSAAVVMGGGDPILTQALKMMAKKKHVADAKNQQQQPLGSIISDSAASIAQAVGGSAGINDVSSVSSFGQEAIDAMTQMASDLANAADEAEEAQDLNKEEEEEKKKAQCKKQSKKSSKGGGCCGGGKACASSSDGLCGGGNCCTGEGIQSCLVSPLCEAQTIAKAAVTCAQAMATQNLYTNAINMVALINPIPDTTVAPQILSSILNKFVSIF